MTRGAVCLLTAGLMGAAVAMGCAHAPVLRPARFDVWDWHPHGISCCMKRMNPLPKHGEAA